MAFPLLLTLFIAVPVTELYLLFRIGEVIGGVETVALVIVTGIVGSALARAQGLKVLTDIQTDLREGRMPTDNILGGVLVLVGGVLLITPGVMTDAVGLLLMVPPVRGLLARLLKAHFRKRMHVEVGPSPFRGEAFGAEPFADGMAPYPGMNESPRVKEVDIREVDENDEKGAP